MQNSSKCRRRRTKFQFLPHPVTTLNVDAPKRNDDNKESREEELSYENVEYEDVIGCLVLVVWELKRMSEFLLCIKCGRSKHFNLFRVTPTFMLKINKKKIQIKNCCLVNTIDFMKVLFNNTLDKIFLNLLEIFACFSKECVN